MDGDAVSRVVEAAGQRWRVIATDALDDRPAKTPDFRLENRALVELTQVMAQEPGRLLQRFTELLIEMGGAGFAAVAFPEDEAGPGETCLWRAAAGRDRSGRCPVDVCRSVVGRDETVLFEPMPGPGADPTHPAPEAMATPFHLPGRPAGLVWVTAGESGRFDAEDRRRLECLTHFVSDSYQGVSVQAELRASEARFRALVTCPGPVVFRASVDGAILDAPGWEALTGQPPEEHLGWGWVRAVHPEDRERFVGDWTRSLASGEATYSDYRLRTAAGDWRWVTGYGVPVRGDEGEIVEWVGTVTDVHELRQAKAALAENEAFHRFAAEAGRSGSWYMRLDTGEVVLSPIAAEHFGLPGEHTFWTRQTWDDFVLEEDRAPLERTMRAATQAASPFEVEFRIRRPDGSIAWLYSRGGVVTDARGAAVRLHGATVDLTENKRAEARRRAIADLNDQLRDATETGPIGLAATAIIGRTLELDWVALGVVDAGGERLEVRHGWSADGADLTGQALHVDALALNRPEAALGEPLIPEPGAILYKPMTGVTGQPWALYAHGESRRVWCGDELAFVRDVVERARTAAQRLRAEADLRAFTRSLEREVETRTAQWSRLWRNSRDLLLVIDRQGILRAANPALTAILGWTPEAVVGRPIGDLVHPEDHEGSRTALQRISEKETPGFENRYRHKDGGYRWLSWVAALEEDLIYATGRHITAEKEAAAALEETRARFRNFFETSYQLRALVSLDGALLEVNATALAAAGVRREDVVGKLLWRTPWFTGTPGIPEAVRVATPRVAAGEVRREDIFLQLPAAGWRWLDFTLRPLHDPRGEAIGIVLEALDITERREAEAALKQSQKLEAMGQLTGGVAHDFNNLLTPIIGGLDLLRSHGAGGPREQRLIEGALQSAERARTLVQRLLAFARRQPLQTGAVDVAALISGMGDLIVSTTGPQISVSARVEPDLPPAQADANQLEMTILNLAVNARDAMPEGGSLTISASRETVRSGHRSGLADGDYIRLSVADTGVGMDETTRSRATEPFFSTKGVGRGTGLGLSMAHGLALQLGGALTIASAPGLGAEVELWLPIDTTAPGAAAAIPPERSFTPTAGVVLLADDESLARATTAAMLSEMGYDVIEAGSGQEALELAAGLPSIDLLITDHLMPGMTGVDLVAAIRARRPGTAALVITGYAETLPADLPCLAKPFRRAQLEACLAALDPADPRTAACAR